VQVKQGNLMLSKAALWFQAACFETVSAAYYKQHCLHAPSSTDNNFTTTHSGWLLLLLAGVYGASVRCSGRGWRPDASAGHRCLHTRRRPSICSSVNAGPDADPYHLAA
jgi:hypothetical protein